MKASTIGFSHAQSMIDRWDHLLASKHLETTVEHLSEGITQRGLLWDGRSCCTTLRPEFIDVEQYAGAMRSAEVTMRALQRSFELVREREVMRKRLGLGAALEEVSQVDIDDPHAIALVGRLDGFFGKDGVLRFIEYNSFPGGIALTHGLSEIFAGMPLFHELSRDYVASTQWPLDELIVALESAQASMSRTGL